MEKFDHTRPYGTIYGRDIDKAILAYEQDGVHYSPDGQVVEKWSSPEKIEGERKLALKRKAREALLAEKREMKEIRRKLIEEL